MDSDTNTVTDETMMTIHFNADLRPVVGKRVGMLHWIADPACSGLPLESWTEAIAREKVRAAIGRDDVPFDVLSYRPWVVSRKVAKQYHVGNVFLCGDAAHSFPPTGGLGLNSGLADVHNIAYKIAAVLQGWAGPKVLETYAEERRPVAVVNAAQSVKNGNKIFSFLKALGTSGIEDVQEARETLLRSIHNPEKQQMIADEVGGQREHFDNLEIHVGYVYGMNQAPAHASHYTPKFVPGARLTHAWITIKGTAALPPVDVSYVKEFSEQDIKSRQYSTLDLCSYDRFTLLVGSRDQWAEHFQALEAAMKQYGVGVSLVAAHHDFDFVYERQEKLFAGEGKLSSGGGLLIRPDQQILRLVQPTDPVSSIEKSLVEHLGFSFQDE
ncbi:hypothetical protein FJTKL_07229 [Diaporthe vaccinii]|uniref:FAD-binding domain-containing protein n=1 Tax=Diaporthe vaccinii TaxID=105482 RepID=A0ABR4EU66_9PEZI